jgi:acetyl-CoA C-acetyltransferase
LTEAYIVGALRTPVGRRRGALSGVHPADLLADVMLGLFEQTGVDPGSLDDVIVGCMEQVGEQANTIGRVAWLAAGLPEKVPAATVERQCASSQQALHFAAMGIKAGVYEAVLVGGVEAMSRVPIGASTTVLPDHWFPERMRKRYEAFQDAGGVEVTQFASAELIAKRWAIDRESLDRYALRSHRNAAKATDEGGFVREILPVHVSDGNGRTAAVMTDEGIRRETSLEKMASLKPIVEGGLTTAATSSQISDGAAALLVMSEARAAKAGLRPRARVVAMDSVGHDFIEGLTAPIPATRRVLAKAGLGLGDIDAVEINEAFASVVLAWQRELGIDPDWFEERVNPRGGAIALGHPIGCSGVRLTTTLLHYLEDTGGRFGLQTMCASHGLATATVLERLG